MTVTEIVAQMLRTWPSLYATRVSALQAIFDSFDSRWESGQLIPSPGMLNNGPKTSPLPYTLEKELDPSGSNLQQALSARRQNAFAQYVVDNAEWLAQDEYSSLNPKYPCSFEGRHFDDFPADATPEWREAALELARAIVTHRYKPGDYHPDYLKQQQDRHDTSVKLAKQFIERLVPASTQQCPYQRAARVRELQREALALGLNLTEADGSPPKTSASN